MTATPAPAKTRPPVDARDVSNLRRTLASIVSKPGLVISIAYVLLITAWIMVPGVFTNHDPLVGAVSDRLMPPSAEHIFGTDGLGRDLFSRVVYGTVNSVQAIVIAVGVGLAIGSLIGLVAGFVGKWVDDLLMRFVEVILSIPALLLSMALITILGFGLVKVAIAVGLTSVATFARLHRAEVMKVRQSLYVEAAKAGGARWWTILFRHVLPNSAGTVISMAALEFGSAVLAVSALSFLGYGAPAPTPEWGRLVSEGRDYIATSWWLVTLPGLVITLLVLATGRIARALEREGRQ